MKGTSCLVVFSLILAGTSVQAQIWGPGILIDGEFDDWSGQVPALVTDVSGDGGSAGRDIAAVYLANDQNNLYVRIESFNANGYDGSEFSGIDGDNDAGTGFNLFGAGLGCDTLVAGASVFGETTTAFNNGAATPDTVPWGPFVDSTNIEFAIALNTTIPGDISTSFPGGLGSTIGFLFGDGNTDAGDVVSGSYTLAGGSTATPGSVIDNFDLYDTDPNAALRTRDISSGGFSVTRENFAAGGPSGGAALGATHTNPAANAFGGSFFSHRFASPIDITGHTDISVDVFGDTGITDQNLWVGLIDTGGTYYAVGAAFPNTAQWSTVNVGATSTWFSQTAGDDNVLDLANIIEWRLGCQESAGAAGGTFNVAYDNFTAVQGSSVKDWMMF